MKTQARSITTNQNGVHEDLLVLLSRHKLHGSQRPIASHTKEAFEACIRWLADWDGEVILDACCGVGESTINIAAQYPQAKILGIDKSIARLQKHNSYAIHSDGDANYYLQQADLNDFWRLMKAHIEIMQPKWHIVKQFILYPNPYPKKSHLSKRWHGSALLPDIIKTCENIEVRSNWRIYLEEFLVAAEYYGLQGEIASITNTPITPFERKYLDAGQTCFKLLICASGSDK